MNADDLGYTEGVNQAVFALHRQHALSSATAMAKGSAIAQALRSAPAGLSVGCHVVLVDGQPASPTDRIGTLAPHGGFRPALGSFAAAAMLGRLSPREIELETAAQIRSLQAAGVVVTHVDTHKHTHLFPAVLRPVLRAARGCGVTAIRNPFEPAWARVATPGAAWMRRAELRVFDRYREVFLRTVRDAEMHTTAGALGVLATGVLNGDVLDRLLHALARHGEADACYELVCHPGIHDAALETQPTRLRAERQREIAALSAVIPRWTAAGAPHRLVSFADLAR